MKLNLIKNSWLHRQGFTLVEVILALGISTLLITSVLGVFVTSKKFYTTNMAGQNLQRNANLLMNKMIKGKLEPGGTFRLSEAVSYTLVSVSELRFIGTDGLERRYFVSADGASLMYRHPTASGVQDEALYTAPAGTTLTVRFWIPAGSSYMNRNVGIDVGFSQTSVGMALSGCTSTLVNIRNHAT